MIRLGVADHFGWAVVVAADDDHAVVDRRRIELIEPELPPAPVEHELGGLDDGAAAALVARVRASVARATSAAFDELAAALGVTPTSISIRAWAPDFPDDIAVQRRPPYQSRADGVMYRQVLADIADARGWAIHLYDAAAVIGQATAVLGPRAADVLERPRQSLGPPWTKDHRAALAATVLAAPR
jgi:hypothetical protein